MNNTNTKPNKKIVFAGGPGTGKSTLIKEFKRNNYQVMNEVSREVIQEARQKGIEHMFISDPLAFSNKLLEKRREQFIDASHLNDNCVFIDRGIPEITAYLDFNKTQYPDYFTIANKKYVYDKIFIFPIWQDIFKQDEVRYETFHQSEEIQKHLTATYRSLGYELIEMPKADTKDRMEFVLEHLNNG